MELPIYNLERIDGLRSRLFDTLRLHFVGTKPAGSDFEALVDTIHQELPDGIARPVVYDSLLYILGQELTSEVLLRLSWLLAGNIKTLKDGRPVQPWRAQCSLEWVPLEIIDHEYVSKFGKERKSGYIYTFRVLAGSPSGLRITAFWSRKYVYFISKSLGFTSSRGKDGVTRLSLHDPVELMSLRIYALLDPEFNSGGMPGFRVISVPNSCVRYNRIIIKARARVDFNCPKNYKHPCFLCHVGTDQCPAACHPRTYLTKLCHVCSKPGLFDLQLHTRMCVNCVRNGANYNAACVSSR